MLNLMRFKYWFFAISLVVILPGLFFLARYGLKLSIDFTGGTLMEVQNQKINVPGDTNKIKIVYSENKIEFGQIQKIGTGAFLIRSGGIDNQKKIKLVDDLQKDFGPTTITRFDTVGPVIGKELTQKALWAVLVASIAIVVYIAYAFRQIPKPYSPWKFGLAAIVALVHDILVVIGVFAILGHLAGVEVDALFVTALLTVMGFSVHDTIVVFDRVRENLRKSGGKGDFEEIVNESLVETLARSLNTSVTVLLVLLTLILFGGESIKWFVVALFVGVFSGTYSSIFNAAPLLVIWEQERIPK